MVMQAYLDESYTDGATFVLAGYIASAEQWLGFTQDWERLLPTTPKNKRAIHEFKMSRMAIFKDRMAAVPPFYDVIERYVPLAISFRVNISDILRATRRLYLHRVPIHWEQVRNPYRIAFYGLLSTFHQRRPALADAGYLPLDEKVDFIFDNRSEKGSILRGWEDFVASRSDEARQHYGATPRFENSEEFLPLQGADLWAWWLRKWYEEGTPEKSTDPDFGSWKGDINKVQKLMFEIGEEALVRDFKNQLAASAPGHIVYDFRWQRRGAV